jgi:hypothetical protein
MTYLHPTGSSDAIGSQHDHSVPKLYKALRVNSDSHSSIIRELYVLLQRQNVRLSPVTSQKGLFSGATSRAREGQAYGVV